MLTHYTFFLLAVFSLLFPNISVASQNNSLQKKTSQRHTITHMHSIGPHGGHIIEDKENSFEVKLEPEKNSVSVYTLRSKNPPPEMSIILYNNTSTGREIELKAVNLSDALPKYQGQLSRDQSQLSVANTPYIGLALRFG